MSTLPLCKEAPIYKFPLSESTPQYHYQHIYHMHMVLQQRIPSWCSCAGGLEVAIHTTMTQHLESTAIPLRNWWRSQGSLRNISLPFPIVSMWLITMFHLPHPFLLPFSISTSPIVFLGLGSFQVYSGLFFRSCNVLLILWTICQGVCHIMLDGCPGLNSLQSLCAFAR